MTTYFINTNANDTVAKISEFLKSIGFTFLVEVQTSARVPCVKIDTSKKLYRFQEWGCAPCEELVSLDQLKQPLYAQMPKPSYGWVERQLASRTKQLLALGYTERHGEMMAPPLGKPPEYVLNDLSPEQAVQAFKEGKSVTVAGKPMTSGTTIEELLDSRLTLKHKRFGRIVLTDQVTDAPEVGTPVFISNSGGSFSNVIYETGRLGALEAGVMHYTEQGAIDHAAEMARLNRDGFVEMDVEWLVKLKNELSTISHAIGEEHFSTAANKVSTLIEGVSKKIGEFYI